MFGPEIGTFHTTTAAMKHVRRQHPREQKLGVFRLGGLLSGVHGQMRTVPQMPALVVNADRARNSLAPKLDYPAATITCA
ncbi:hypothetical protein [Paraburkholderia sp. SIMBA_030]|uniref:hypothetical protein n=1 Tax=Paraburkholderia sp. SIMBA_030 TaxID=3085773 RepID=UPI00397DB7F5